MGRLKSPYGVQGWIWMDSFTVDPISVFDWKPWYLARQPDLAVGRTAVKDFEVKPQAYKLRTRGYIVQIAGFERRDLVEPLINCLIEIDRDHLPLLAQDEFYWRDLNGCKVVTQNKEDLGCVSHVFSAGSNDVLVVKSGEDSLDDRERMVPFDARYVLSVDIDKGVIIVDWDPEF